MVSKGIQSSLLYFKYWPMISAFEEELSLSASVAVGSQLYTPSMTSVRVLWQWDRGRDGNPAELKRLVEFKTGMCN